MARINCQPLPEDLLRMDPGTLGRLLVETSAGKDGRGLTITMTLMEEAELFCEHDLLDEWLTELVASELARQGKPCDTRFIHEPGGIYRS